MKCKVANHQDRKKWDTFLARQSNGNFRQSFAWGNIKRLAGWEPIYLYAEESGELRALISILKRNIPLLGKSILYACRGPILDWNDDKALKELVKGIFTFVKIHNPILLRIDPEPIYEDIMRKQLHSLNFLSIDRPYTNWNRTRYTLRLFLDKDEDELLAQMRKNNRYDIKVCYKKGIKIKVGFEERDENRFYELMNQLETEKSAIHHKFEYYKNVLHEIIYSGTGTIIKAIYDNKIIGILVLAFSGNKCWAIYMVNDYQYRKLMPNKLLFWEGIKFAKKKGCIFFDMGAMQGTSFDPKANQNTFKMAFRPAVIYFPEYFDLSFSPFYYKLFITTEYHILPLIYRLKTIQLGSR